MGVIRRLPPTIKPATRRRAHQAALAGRAGAELEERPVRGAQAFSLLRTPALTSKAASQERQPCRKASATNSPALPSRSAQTREERECTAVEGPRALQARQVRGAGDLLEPRPRNLGRDARGVRLHGVDVLVTDQHERRR